MHTSKGIILALAGAWMMVMTPPSLAQAQSPPQAIAYITDAADHICVKAATGGSSSTFSASADVSAELDNLLRKLAKAGVKASANYQTTAHEGVLASQVLDATKEANHCRLHVFDVLSANFFPPQPHPTQSTRGNNSPIIDTMNGGTMNIGN